MRAYERFLKYVRVNTMACGESETVPSSECQFTLGRALAAELRELGLTDAVCDDKCYVYATLPATAGCEDVPAIGFISHIDTVDDFAGDTVVPQVFENYDGRDIELGHGRYLTVSDFPHLKTLIGKTLITASGDTILGADDKAGIAEIVTLCEGLIASGAPHGKICVGFTPDEEIGRGADCFDVKRFGAVYAYTVDGGAEGGVVYENFNAASAVFEIKGVNIHPGGAKGRMVNAARVAFEINAMLPSLEIPECTEGYEGFYHLCEMEGSVSSARLEYIVRDHGEGRYESRLATLSHIEKLMNERYGEGTVKLTLKEQYRNMLECIKPCMEVVDYAIEATRRAGFTELVGPIRGGTDGARLSFMGLPCPNLGTGAYAGHGPYEHVTAEGMDNSVLILENIVKIYTEKTIKERK